MAPKAVPESTSERPSFSEKDWRLVCDGSAPFKLRLEAFGRVLEQTGGWWRPSHLTLLEYLCAEAMSQCRQNSAQFPEFPADPEGLAQETAIALFYGAATVKTSFPGWVAGTTRNLIRMELRRAGCMATAIRSDNDVDQAFDPRLQVESEVPVDPMVTRLRAAIESLPPALHELADLILQCPSTVQQMETLKISACALRKRRQRLYKLLRKILEEEDLQE